MEAITVVPWLGSVDCSAEETQKSHILLLEKQNPTRILAQVWARFFPTLTIAALFAMSFGEERLAFECKLCR